MKAELAIVRRVSAAGPQSIVTAYPVRFPQDVHEKSRNAPAVREFVEDDNVTDEVAETGQTT